MDEITKEQFDENWDLIKDEMVADGTEQQFTKQELVDIKISLKDKIRAIKTNKNFTIEIGDCVMNHGISAEVLDVDGEFLCVRTNTGEVEIWEKAAVNKYKRSL